MEIGKALRERSEVVYGWRAWTVSETPAGRRARLRPPRARLAHRRAGPRALPAWRRPFRRPDPRAPRARSRLRLRLPRGARSRRRPNVLARARRAGDCGAHPRRGRPLGKCRGDGGRLARVARVPRETARRGTRACGGARRLRSPDRPSGAEWQSPRHRRAFPGRAHDEERPTSSFRAVA